MTVSTRLATKNTERLKAPLEPLPRVVITGFNASGLYLWIQTQTGVTPNTNLYLGLDTQDIHLYIQIDTSDKGLLLVDRVL